MPPHKPNRQERELQKNLDAARGSIENKDAYITKLEGTIAGLNERVTALQEQAPESAKLKEINRQLGKENARFSLEFVSMSQKLSSHELAAIFSKKTIRDLENQNAAFRAALREVL